METLEPFSATNNKNEVPDAKSKDLEDKVRQMVYNVLGVDNSNASRPDQYNNIPKRSNNLDLARFNSDKVYHARVQEERAAQTSKLSASRVDYEDHVLSSAPTTGRNEVQQSHPCRHFPIPARTTSGSFQRKQQNITRWQQNACSPDRRTDSYQKEPMTGTFVGLLDARGRNDAAAAALLSNNTGSNSMLFESTYKSKRYNT